MPKLPKALLIVAGVFLVLAVVAVLAMNLYVQSAGSQNRIEHALSSSLKLPVHITSTFITPWSGLKATGITIPQVAPATGNFLEASAFTAHFDWLALFKHRLDASDLTLQQPKITWFQSAGGRWDLPRVAASPPPVPAGSPSASPSAEKVHHPVINPWEVNIHKLAVNDASFDFFDEKGLRLLEFAGVQFDCADPTVAGSQGHASGKVVSLRDLLYFHDMSTNWSFAHGDLKLSSFLTQVGGGQISGDAGVAMQTKHSPYTIDVAFERVDVNRLMTDAGQPTGQITGALKGWLDISGNSGKKSTINGKGHLELTNGTMQGIDLFQMLGQLLNIPDLVELNLKTAEADLRVVSGVTYVDAITLKSQNLQLTAHGTVGSDGKLDLDARLTVNAAAGGHIPAFIFSNFKSDAAGAPDERYIDFAVNNTISHPRTNLSENILGHRIQSQMTDILKNIFGKKPSKHAPSDSGGPQP